MVWLVWLSTMLKVFFFLWFCINVKWRYDLWPFILWADVCLTYENQTALKRENTKWTQGRDIWWQVGILFQVVNIFIDINGRVSISFSSYGVCLIQQTDTFSLFRMLFQSTPVLVMLNGLMQRILYFCFILVEAQENQRFVNTDCYIIIAPFFDYL